MNLRFLNIFAVLPLFFLLSCENDNSLNVSTSTINFEAEGGSHTFTIATDAENWSIDNPAPDWIILTKNAGDATDTTIQVSVNSKTIQFRSDTLSITAGNAGPKTVIVTQKASAYLYTMNCNSSQLDFSRVAGTQQFDIVTTAPQWTITSKVNWITIDHSTGTTPNAKISVTTTNNSTGKSRADTLFLTAQYTPTVVIVVTQSGDLYPSHNTSPQPADATGMGSTAIQLAKNMFAGWNMGNSLEVPGSETGWGNPKASQRLIDSIYKAGFNAIRLPCAWNSYIENTTTYKLKESWLARVKEVIDYCYKNQMYVIINIHWDGGWLENNCTTAKQVENNAKQKAIWEQIATYFRDYDEHLLFAGTNEPNVNNATEMTVLLSYLQTFVDAVRSTGGRNAYRTLVFQGPSTDIEKTNNLMKTLPTDNVPNRLMAEIHYYTPWNFCGMEKDESWGKMFYYWGANYHNNADPTRNANWGEESTVRTNFGLMKTKFASKGIPVILGEYAVTRRATLTGEALTKHLTSRAYYYEYITQQAKNNGLIPFVWDNGGTGNNACGIFNRNSFSVFDKQVLEKLMVGAKNGVYPY